MRVRLITLLFGLVACTFTLASQNDEYEDRSAGQLISEIAVVLTSKSSLDMEAHSALGSSMEFLFLQLKRSKTKAATDALARTVVLRIDAGGGESRTEAILSKGPLIVGRLKKTVQTEYHRLCSGATAPACMSQGEVAKYVAILIEALHRRRVIPTERL